MSWLDTASSVTAPRGAHQLDGQRLLGYLHESLPALRAFPGGVCVVGWRVVCRSTECVPLSKTGQAYATLALGFLHCASVLHQQLPHCSSDTLSLPHYQRHLPHTYMQARCVCASLRMASPTPPSCWSCQAAPSAWSCASSHQVCVCTVGWFGSEALPLN